ncbi:hypothetical protein LguiA_004315 [Lonicera macranthoides]
MTNKRPMTAFERQRKSKKYCAVGAAKQYGKTKEPVTPTPLETENDPPLKMNHIVEVKKVISMLYETFHGDKAKDISIVARNAYDILLNAMKATAPEKTQEHDLNATLSGTTRPLAKEKGNTYVTRRRNN